MIYLPSKPIRYAGIVVLLSGLMGLGYFVFFPHPPGDVVVTVSNNAPIPKTGFLEQAVMGIAQRAFNQEMQDSKLPTVRVDMGETLPLDYNPVQVKKDVKDGTLMIGIKTSGLTPYESNRAYMLGDGAYQLIDLSSGKVVWQGEDKGTTYSPEAGQDQVILIHGDKKVQNRVSHKTSVQYRKIGTLKELPAGDYAFKGRIVFSKYGFPIEKADFVLSENVAADKGWMFVLASLAGLFVGFFLIFITVPPQMRTKGKTA